MKKLALALLALGLIGVFVAYDAVERHRIRPHELALAFVDAHEAGDLTGLDQLERLIALTGFDAGRVYLEQWNRGEPDLAFDPTHDSFYLIERSSEAGSRLIYARDGFHGPLGLPIYFGWRAVEVRGDVLHLEAEISASGSAGEAETRVGLEAGPMAFEVPLGDLGEGLKLEHLRRATGS